MFSGGYGVINPHHYPSFTLRRRECSLKSARAVPGSLSVLKRAWYTFASAVFMHGRPLNQCMHDSLVVYTKQGSPLRLSPLSYTHAEVNTLTRGRVLSGSFIFPVSEDVG